jgi:hypothetical protein
MTNDEEKSRPLMDAAKVSGSAASPSRTVAVTLPWASLSTVSLSAGLSIAIRSALPGAAAAPG